MTKKKWLAVYVKMHHEKKVRDRLTNLGIENFLPIQVEIRQWSDRKKKIERVLTPMMIFVRVNSEEQHIVIAQPSVLRFLVLRGEHAPAVIPEKQMDNFRFMLNFSEESINFTTDDLKQGEKVKVIKGPLSGLEGELVNLEDKSSIVIRINQLGCAMVEMNGCMVKKL